MEGSIVRAATGNYKIGEGSILRLPYGQALTVSDPVGLAVAEHAVLMEVRQITSSSEEGWRKTASEIGVMDGLHIHIVVDLLS